MLTVYSSPEGGNHEVGPNATNEVGPNAGGGEQKNINILPLVLLVVLVIVLVLVVQY